jgi:parvulin-like peptidyl-prolyl isomerase
MLKGCELMRSLLQRRALAICVLACLGMVATACSGPTLSDGTNAASVDGQTISMAQYLAETRLIDAVNHLNDPTTATWQTLAGRQTLAKAQQRVLSLLIGNITLQRYLHISDKDLQTQENVKLDQLFAAVPDQYKGLEDQGILSRETYRPFVAEQVLDADLEQNLHITTAHIRILTVKDKATADKLLKQLQNGGDWTTLATKNSIDGAQGAGGDVPTLVPYFFPPQIDQVVFAPASPDSKVHEVQSRMGWSLVQVLGRTPNVAYTALDSTLPIIPTSQVSVQNAAIVGVINHIGASDNPVVNANWCNDVSGGACPALFPSDQLG